MTSIDKKKKLRPSILDRLIDNDPGSNVEKDPDQQQKLKQLRNSVRRDLENLLNTRFRMLEPADEYTELKKSLLNYGLPDLATVNISDTIKQKEFVDHLQSILVDFEPRFKSVKVNYVKNANALDRSLRFRIDATLYAEPSPEIVVFDSIIEPVTRTINVEETSHGR
ncbi:MAG: type VI secretion system baseplate subunit TssE [Gammaproteobacteria bacterium]|nr:MAG: type VI secretion system baseplate subunit TssE [Gammaproteobacteria bacterium]